MNPIETLKTMLDMENIPYDYFCTKWDKRLLMACPNHYKREPDMYNRYQIIYGQSEPNNWKLDAIWQYGSYGRYEGMVEVYGDMIKGDPYPVTPEEAFKMIKDDWRKKYEND